MKRFGQENPILATLIFSSLVSVSFFIIGTWFFSAGEYWYLVWNLFLAWLPLLFSWLLLRTLKKKRWASWQGLLYTFLWLFFLPNSFYIISDLIHLQTDVIVNGLYVMVMMFSFSVTGLLLGYISLYSVHKQLLKRFRDNTPHLVVGIILFLSSFAIYLGRYLHWNTWDAVINPAGLIFDVSDRIINPGAHTQTATTTLSFFVLLGSMYIVIWQFIKIIRKTVKD